MEHQAALLLGRLGLDEPHVSPGDGFADLPRLQSWAAADRRTLSERRISPLQLMRRHRPSLLPSSPPRRSVRSRSRSQPFQPSGTSRDARHLRTLIQRRASHSFLSWTPPTDLGGISLRFKNVRRRRLRRGHAFLSLVTPARIRRNAPDHPLQASPSPVSSAIAFDYQKSTLLNRLDRW